MPKQDVKRALVLLSRAIDLHDGHIEGEVPTSEESQAKLMELMEGALAALGGKPPADMGKAQARVLTVTKHGKGPGSPEHSGTDFFLKAEVAKVDEELGLVFGWGIVCKVDGEPYFDLQGDHIPEDSMLEATTDFMLKSRISGDMHLRDDAGVPIQDGSVVFSFPLTEQVAKSMGISSDRTGWMVAIRPGAEVLEKFRSGAYQGFSIGGGRLEDEDAG